MAGEIKTYGTIKNYAEDQKAALASQIYDERLGMFQQDINSDNNDKINIIGNGFVYDISAAHNNTKYADLTAALGTNGANVPQELRKGGMSVKFVQSSDNKYVQFRLMSDSFNTTVSNWQGVDEEPIVSSKNLVESGGVAKISKAYSSLMTPSSVIEGKKVRDNDGTIISSSSFNINIYSVTPSKAYEFSGRIKNQTAHFVWWFDAQNNPISSEPYKDNGNTLVEKINQPVVAPANAAYMYLNIQNFYSEYYRVREINYYNIKDVRRECYSVSVNRLRDKKVSLLGDSNWTFTGVSTGDSSRYAYGKIIEDVRDTWWGKLLMLSNGAIEVNASVGSSSVTDNRYYDVDGFLTRVGTLGNPDVVIIGGGLNEPPNVTVGTFDPTKDISELDTMVFADAYDKMVRQIVSLYSPEYIIMVIHSKTQAPLKKTMHEIGDYYHIEIIDLYPVYDYVTYLDNIHYDQNGSNIVCDYILRNLNLVEDGKIEEAVEEAKEYTDQKSEIIKNDVAKLKSSTLEEIVSAFDDDDVAGFIVDKNCVPFAKVMKNGAIERLVDNSRDIATNQRFSNIESLLSYISTEYPDNGSNIVKYLIGKNGAIVGNINNNGKVFIYELEAENFKASNIEDSLPVWMQPLLNISSNEHNSDYINDSTYNYVDEHKAEIRIDGIKKNTVPMLLIHDDDAIEPQLRTSYNGDATAADSPSSVNANRGGYASLLLPVLLAFNAKYGNIMKGKAVAEVSAEGQRIGLTSFMKLTDDFSGSLNNNGQVLNKIVEKAGWDVCCHSMTARYITHSYLVNGLDSEFANSLLVGATYEGDNGLGYKTTTCYDTVTEKNYKVKPDFSGWDECPVHYAKPYCALTKESDSKCVINPSYSVEYQVKTWLDRAKIAGLKYLDRVMIKWGASHTIWHAREDMKYVDYLFTINATKTNTIPVDTFFGRFGWTPRASVNGISGEHADSYNVYNPTDYARLIGVIDRCVSQKGLTILTSHTNTNAYQNKYYPASYGFNYPTNTEPSAEGMLDYYDANYPSEWVVPLKYIELQDMLNNDDSLYWTTPPQRLGIQSWAEWYPCPGTTFAMLWDAMKYAIDNGVYFANTMEAIKMFGNRLAIGIVKEQEVESSWEDDRLGSIPEQNKSYCVIGADGGIRYSSKEQNY